MVSIATLNSAALIALSGRMLSSLFGMLLLFVVLAYTSEQLQGYYYLVLAIVGIQLFFDLGMTASVSQELACIRASSNQKKRDAVIAGFIVSALKLYFLIASVLSVIVFLYGYIVLSENKEFNTFYWILISFFIGVSYFVSGLLSIINGFQHVTNVAILTSLKSVTNIIVSGVFLYLTLDVNLSIFLGLTISVILTIFVFIYFYIDRLHLLREISLIRYDWKGKLLFFQIKLMISWFSGYVLTHGLVLYVNYHFSIVDAGKFGAASQAITYIASLLFIALSTAQTTIGNYLSGGKVQEALDLFKNRLSIVFSLLIVFFGLFSLIFQFFSGYDWFDSLILRVPGSESFIWIAFLLLVTLGNYSLASFFRALKTDPFWILGFFQLLFLFMHLFIFSESILVLNDVYISLVLAVLICGFIPALYMFKIRVNRLNV